MPWSLIASVLVAWVVLAFATAPLLGRAAARHARGLTVAPVVAVRVSREAAHGAEVRAAA